MKKVYPSAEAALDGVLFDGMTIASGGFGLCGIPELLIAAIRKATEGMLSEVSEGERAEARTARAELKNQLKMGQFSLTDALSSSDPIVGKMKVVSLLESLPSVGKVKARRLMEEIGIADNRRVQGLGEQQKQALLAQFAK